MRDDILSRRSVRTYEKRKLSEDTKKLTETLIQQTNQMKGPFGHEAHFFFHDQQAFLDDDAKKIGTYGFVKNPPAFFGGITQNEFEHLIDFGYLFEHILIELTKHELGTVWLGGTFNRSAFNFMVSGNEIIPAISPVGYPEEKFSLREKVIRFGVKADRRKPFNELFYLNDFAHPLETLIPHDIPYYHSLLYVQAGPSASNKQPWRLLIEDKKIHLYLEPTPNYGTSLSFPIQLLDMGIAIYHLEAGLKEDQLSYQIKPIEHPEKENLRYIISFLID
jgi:hypothetical protein